MIGLRMSLTKNQRDQRSAETHEVAVAVIDAQRAAREVKTARLRALRLAAEAENAVTHANAAGELAGKDKR